MSRVNTRKLGEEKEQLAVKYLAENGYRIVEQNFFCKAGEIDIIAENEGYLCFVEVKYRENLQSGFPEEAVSISKIKRISRSAQMYLNMCGYSSDTACRFDVVAILGSEVKLIKNAFDYMQ